MKFNTRSRVGVAALIAGTAVTIGSLGSGGFASASNCVLNGYTWSGSGSTNLLTGVIIPAPPSGAIFQAIFVTYSATGTGETIKATIGGLQVGTTGGAGANVSLLDGTATNITGGEIGMMNATGTPGSLIITNIFVQTNTCTEDEPTTTVAQTTVPPTVAPTTVAPTTAPPTVAPTTAPATTQPPTVTTQPPTATTQAPATTVVAPTTIVASGAVTTTTIRGITATSVSGGGLTTTTIKKSLSPSSGSNLPQTGGNLDAMGFLAGMALFVGGALLIARRRTANA